MARVKAWMSVVLRPFGTDGDLEVQVAKPHRMVLGDEIASAVLKGDFDYSGKVPTGTVEKAVIKLGDEKGLKMTGLEMDVAAFDADKDVARPAFAEGLSGDDRIFGSRHRDKLFGYDGDDLVHGARGNDRVDGGAGDDLIIGGRGSDKLIGGAGDDVFRFKAGDGIDLIKDFTLGEDLIEVKSGAKAFADLSIEDGDKGAVVSWAEVEVTLKGVAAEDLGADDFLFG